MNKMSHVIQEYTSDSDSSNTAYDDVFHTMLLDCSELIIPVINETFKTHHTLDEKITFFHNEFYAKQKSDSTSKIITDSHFAIGTYKYHMECQSTPDGTMIIRMFEYNTQIALDDAEFENNTLSVSFPNSALLFLRHNKHTPDYMKIVVNVPGASCSYHIPVIKIQTYSIDELFEKNLLFLIPFHIFAYENNFKTYEENSSALSQLKEKYAYIFDRLDALTKDNTITRYTQQTILEMSMTVLRKIAAKYSEIKKGLGDTMTTSWKIINHPARVARKEEAKDNAANLFVNGVTYDIVRKSITFLTDEELMEIYRTYLENKHNLTHN